MSVTRLKPVFTTLFPLFVLSMFAFGGLVLAVSFSPATPSVIPTIESNMIKELPAHGPAATNQFLFFKGEENELWRTNLDGTNVSLIKVFPNPLSQLTVFNTVVLFTVDDNEHGKELWRSDGTSMGTRLVKDIYPGNAGSFPAAFKVGDQTVYFKADDGQHGVELWITDGSAQGTRLVKDINPGPGGGLFLSGDMDLRTMDNMLFFSANDGQHGKELWLSDGTMSGTYLLGDIRIGINSSNLRFLTDIDDVVFLRANDGVIGDELWRTDGTTSGTYIVKDIHRGSPGSSPQEKVYNSGSLGKIGGQFFFSANDGQYGDELWVSDGTTSGTYMVKDINPGEGNFRPGYNSSSFVIYAERVVGDYLFFDAVDGVHGRELWISDGSESGTTLLKDIWRGAESGFNSTLYSLGELGGELVFPANNGIHGEECWRSDGTQAGTFMIRDINLSGSGGCAPFRVLGDIYLFMASDNENERQVWATKGTFAETVKVTGHTNEYYLHPYPAPPQPEIVGFYGAATINDYPGGALWALHRNDIERLFIPGLLNEAHVPSATGEIIFISDRDGGNNEVYNIVDIGNQELHRLTDDSYVYGDPDCASDGRIVLNANLINPDGIYLLDYDTGAVTRVGDSSLVGKEPVWSPDNERLSFSHQGDIYTVRVNGTDLRQLTSNAWNEIDPEWSPDGSQIAFVSDRTGIFQLYVMNVDGQNITPLAEEWLNTKEPSWAPDGKTIAFYSDVDGDSEIYKLDLEISQVSQLTFNQVKDTVPVWSPDGQWILFETERDGDHELYVMDAEGNKVTQITNDPAFDLGGCWYQRP